MTAPLILAPEGLSLSAEEAVFFAQAQPWGFILFLRNLDSADQIRALCAELRDSVGWDAPILIDQEGGRVQRLRPPLAREWLPPLDDVARFGANAGHAIYLRHRIIAGELLALGIDVNCAPTLDIAGEMTHPFLRNRCFGETPQSVTAMGRAAAGGLLDGGVLPVIKHMPGHGRTQVDSHLALPTSNADRETLGATDFAPFRELADLPLGMSAHMVLSAVDPDRPATQSAECIDLIRGEIGFQGLLMTDDISMEALEGDVAHRGAVSLAAGCDVVLHCNGSLAEMRALAAACGEMSDAAKARADAAIACRVTPDPIDLDALFAEYESLA